MGPHPPHHLQGLVPIYRATQAALGRTPSLPVLARLKLGQPTGWGTGSSGVLCGFAAHRSARRARQLWAASARSSASICHDDVSELVPLEGGPRTTPAPFERVSRTRSCRGHPVVSERI